MIEQNTSLLLDAPVAAITNEIHSRYGNSTVAILFYGSCMRSKSYFDGLLDLYVVVDSYHSAYDKKFLSIINTLLPPNVFNIEIPFNNHKIKAKYAVISENDFKSASYKWFHSYIWGRFTQPISVTFARDNRSRDAIENSLANATHAFLSNVIPMLPNEFESKLLWNTGFKLTYRAELRAEKQKSITALYDSNKTHFDSLMMNSINTLPFTVEVSRENNRDQYKTDISTIKKFSSSILWKIRILQGKTLSILRLLKALFTFEFGAEYIVAKLEKHSGEKIELTEKVKRYPLIHGWIFFLKLYVRNIYR